MSLQLIGKVLLHVIIFKFFFPSEEHHLSRSLFVRLAWLIQMGGELANSDLK